MLFRYMSAKLNKLLMGALTLHAVDFRRNPLKVGRIIRAAPLQGRLMVKACVHTKFQWLVRIRTSFFLSMENISKYLPVKPTTSTEDRAVFKPASFTRRNTDGRDIGLCPTSHTHPLLFTFRVPPFLVVRVFFTASRTQLLFTVSWASTVVAKIISVSKLFIARLLGWKRDVLILHQRIIAQPLGEL